jgi:subtilisin family serine protease
MMIRSNRAGLEKDSSGSAIIRRTHAPWRTERRGLAGWLVCLAIVPVIAVLGLDVARAGTIQAPVARRIAADSLDAAGFAGKAKALLRGTEPVAGADGRIAVQVTFSPEASAGDPAGPGHRGVTPPAWLTSMSDCLVTGSLGPCVEVRIPSRQVRALASHLGVLHVGLAPRPALLAESEGLSAMRVPEFWSKYHRGEGVRVGVLDVGFAGYERLLGSELPAHVKTKAFYDAGSGPDLSGGGEPHGTACAEVVHDVAPDAEIYLANAGSSAEMGSAVTWLIDQGVEVISHSIAWPLGGGDGTGPIHDSVSIAHDNGVIWVNAAGNFAMGFWGGYWLDADGDRILDVDSLGTEALLLPAAGSGPDVHVWLNWDRWPYSTDLQFAIELLNREGETIASSQSDWADYPFAFRPLDVNGTVDLSGMSLRIRCIVGTPAGRFLRVTRTDGDLALESRTPAGSIAMPADSPYALAVGAYAWSDQRLEPYSSYGPTLDGRAKPEILGPDAIQNSVLNPFSGTSAACPHVAGAIALLLGAGPRGALFDARPDATQLTALLQREAAPVPGSPPAGAIGWGQVRLPQEATKQAGPQLRALGNGSRSLVLRLERTNDAVGPCDVFDLEGRLVGRLEGSAKGIGTVEFAAAPLASLHLARGRYWAREPVTGARVAFLWPGLTTR